MADFIQTHFGFSDVSNWTLLAVAAVSALVALAILYGLIHIVTRRYGGAPDEHEP